MSFLSRWVVAPVGLLGLVSIGCNNATAPQSESPAAVQSGEEAAAPSGAVSHLDIGDRAPLLQIAEWIQGAPVTEYQAGKIYVVEFWATWCSPCRAGMPHLSELQEAYRDEVFFIGVTRENAEVVQDFLEKPADERISGEEGRSWSDLMRYTVVADADGATSAAFMEAANENGIPCAFVVGIDGKIEWIGHPMEIDEPLKEIAGRTWNREAGKIARREKNKQAKQLQQFKSAYRNNDWEQALSLLAELEEEMPNPLMALSYRLSIFNQMGRTEKAISVFEELTEKVGDNARMLNRLAWSAADDEASEPALLRRVLIGAERAAVLTGYADGDILDTFARIHFALNDLEQAILWQSRAVETAPRDGKTGATLQKYTAAAEAAAAEGTEETSVDGE